MVKILFKNGMRITATAKRNAKKFFEAFQELKYMTSKSRRIIWYHALLKCFFQ